MTTNYGLEMADWKRMLTQANALPHIEALGNREK